MKLNVRKVETELAKELQRQRVDRERKHKEVQKICEESDELRELKEKIRLAYLNKERAAQLVENQYRKQKELVTPYTSPNRVKKLRLKHVCYQMQRRQQRN
jgi:hypothetical protein